MAKAELRILRVGALQTNCYLVWETETDQGVIIDPGDDADYIMRVVKDEGFEPVKIVATHGHFDHILAVNELKLAYNIPFMVNKKDEFLVKRCRESTKHFVGFDPGPAPKVDEYIKRNKLVVNEKLSFQVIETPGHTPGSVSLYSAEHKSVWVGDVIFAGGGVGRTDFTYASEEDLRASIEKLLKLPPETTVYSGHGEITTIGAEINQLKGYLGL